MWGGVLLADRNRREWGGDMSGRMKSSNKNKVCFRSSFPQALGRKETCDGMEWAWGVCCNPDWRGNDRRDHYSGSDDGDGNGDSGGGGGAVAADMAKACNSTEIEIGKSQDYYDCCQLPDQLALANGPAVKITTRRMWEFNVDCGLVVFLHWESNNFKMEHASQPSQYKKQKVISNNTNAQACLLLRWS